MIQQQEMPDSRRPNEHQAATAADAADHGAGFALAAISDALRDVTAAPPGAVYQARLEPSGLLRFTWLSAAMAELLEVPVDELLQDASRAITLIHPDDLPRYEQSVRRSAELLEPWHYECRIRTPGGRVKHIRGQSNPMRCEDGAVQWIGVLVDITALRETERALRDSERRLSAALDAVDIGTFEILFSEKRLDLSRRAAALLGVADTTHDFPGDSIAAAIVAEDRQGVIDEARAAFADRRQFSIEFRVASAGSAARWLRARGSMVVDNTGNFDRAMGAIEDISLEKATESRIRGEHSALEQAARVHAGELALAASRIDEQRRERDRAIEQLRESEARLHSILDHSPAVVFVKDADGRYLMVNIQFERIFNIRRDWLIGRTDYDLFSRDMAETLRSNDRLVIESGRALEIEETVQQVDGSHTYISIKFPLRRADGTTYAMCGIATDISDRKRAEAELAQHRANLEQLVEARTRELDESRRQLRQSERLASLGTLAAGVAHEINNPIGAIRMTAELALSDGKLHQPLREALQAIIADTDRCSTIIRGILRFSRVSDAAKSTLELNDLIRQSTHLIDRASLERSVICRVELCRQPLTLIGNRTELEQVVVNLVRNAAQASPPRSTIVARTSRDGDAALLVVEDKGHGMSEHVRQHLFDPFFTTREAHGGTGLGLSIVHGIVTEHGGSVTVSSKEGFGSTFTVRLPLHAVQSESLRGRSAGSSATDTPRSKPRRAAQPKRTARVKTTSPRKRRPRGKG